MSTGSGKTGVIALALSAFTSITVALIAAWPQGKAVDYERLVFCEDHRERLLIEIEEVCTADETQVREYFRSFLNGQEVIAWIKRYDEARDTYIMWVISDAYATTFKVRLDNYELESQGDRVVWHPNIARMFRLNDDEAMYSRSCVTVLEPISEPFNQWMPVRKCHFRAMGNDYINGYLLERWPHWAGEEPEKAFTSFDPDELNRQYSRGMRTAR